MLKRFAQVLEAVFRREEVVARIGGDEFTVLLPNTGTQAAEDGLCRVKNLLEVHNALFEGNP